MAYFVRDGIRVALGAGLLLTMLPHLALAQYGQTPGDLLDTFRALRPNWFTAAAGAANRLFGLLALVEFAWTAVLLVLDKSDLQGWTAALIRRMMFVGAFLALLVNGPLWIPAIIDSFAIIGQNAAGLGGGGLSPGDVFVRGLQIAGNLGESASRAGFFSSPGSALALVLAAVLTFLAFVIVSVHFIMALVESYVVVGAGFIFLGFGGSRWTAPYVERYIALAVAVGVKLMVLYMLIGAGMTLSAAWTARALGASLSASPIMEALDIMGGAVIFGILCWQAPKFTASLLGGSPAFSGGDVAAMGFAGAQAGIVAATLGAGAVKMLAARGAAAGGSMTVSQAAGMGAGGSGGAAMGSSSRGGSSSSGRQAGGSSGSGSSGGSNGKGFGGSGGNDGQNGGFGPGGSGPQPKPPTLGSGGGTSSQSASQSVSGDSAGHRSSTDNATSTTAMASRSTIGSPGVNFAEGSMDLPPVSDVGRGAVPMVDVPSTGGAPGATLESPQTITNPQTVGAPMHNTSPITVGNECESVRSNAVLPSFGGRPVDQPAPPAMPTENGALQNPQTISQPQTVTSPMANTSPMTATPSGVRRVANAAHTAEQALDRTGRFALGLRQSLPPDGSGGGGPAQLNLHGGDE